ncbi:hypothetical protein AALA13_11870 [Lachnospiraceae bacterium 50-23]
MEQREIMEEVVRLHSENPGKFIKIRDIFEDVLADRDLGGAQDMSDREYDRIRYRFRFIDVPFSWCVSKDATYQLYKAVRQQRSQSRGGSESFGSGKKSAKSKKRGIFGLFG